jgi:hypothetical protein
MTGSGCSGRDSMAGLCKNTEQPLGFITAGKSRPAE